MFIVAKFCKGINSEKTLLLTKDFSINVYYHKIEIYTEAENSIPLCMYHLVMSVIYSLT